MLFDIICYTVICFCVVNFLSTFVYASCLAWWNCVFRVKLNKWWLLDWKVGFTRAYDRPFQIIVLDGVGGCILTTFSGLLTRHLSILTKTIIGYGLVGLLVVLLSTFLLRFLVDIGRNLKHNHKTGESEKLTEITKELEALKRIVRINDAD